MNRDAEPRSKYPAKGSSKSFSKDDQDDYEESYNQGYGKNQKYSSFSSDGSFKSNKKSPVNGTKRKFASNAKRMPSLNAKTKSKYKTRPSK